MPSDTKTTPAMEIFEAIQRDIASINRAIDTLDGDMKYADLAIARADLAALTARLSLHLGVPA